MPHWGRGLALSVLDCWVPECPPYGAPRDFQPKQEFRRGETREALKALRDAERAGWRGPVWRFFRDHDANLESIRNEPDFKAIFADIERDMADQRARLAARPKDAPLEIAEAGT